MSVKNVKLAFGATFLALAAQMSGAEASDPTEAPINGESTAVLLGKKSDIDEPGRASFTINIGELGLGKKLDLRFSKNTAIIFTGTGKEPGRVCPFFNLESRKYEIEQIDEDVYKVTADINNDDVTKVRASGCMVTTRPDLNKIKYLKPN